MKQLEPQLDGLRPVGQASAAAPSVPPSPVTDDADLVESELLIEEVSIDGMCGVY